MLVSVLQQISPRASNEGSETYLRVQEHCLNHLRRTAMCHGDVGLMIYNWRNDSLKPQAQGTAHQCVDWDSLAKWTSDRSFDMFEPGLLIHPTKGM